MQAQHTTTGTPRASTFKPRVRRLGAGLYLVESATTPGLGHQTTATTCGCRAGQFGKTCRHQRLVAALEPRFQAWYAQRAVQTQAALAAAPAGAAAPGLDAQLTASERRLAVILLGFWPYFLLDQWPHIAAVSLDRIALLGSESHVCLSAHACGSRLDALLPRRIHFTKGWR